MQATENILLIKPANFVFYTETASSNAFQIQINESEEKIKQMKLQEFENLVSTLESNSVNVFVVDDTQYPEKPDAIFPNNWISFHADGTIILYPMYAPNRRNERREDIIDYLKAHFSVNKILDLSKFEKEQKYLEGTGSIVFDHINKIAYACLSLRTNKELFIEVCNHLNYKPISFYAHDKSGKEIYHTNVMMCMAEQFCVICLDSISDKIEKEMMIKSISETDHQIIDITFEQMNNFAGNMLLLQSSNNNTILALSERAFNTFTEAQRHVMKEHADLVPLYIPTIETIGGGSARCMIAQIFLPKKV